ncbi:hypothetical protein M885DRAFT_504824 [Pelagophyceae sp. CCMP2097]|nr:hypothetical protein M885DRAFT_504824 [Pelagophyceae sp. CCMP2097]
MSAHDADFVFDTFKRSYATSWKCGRCKNRIDEVLLDGLPRPGVSSEEVRSALRAICNGGRETKILVVVVLLVGGAVAVPCYSAIGSRAVHQLKFVGPVRRHLNSVMFAIGAGYLLAGGALFQYTEQKLADQDSFTYWNSCYFAFQTLTTLGLGDFTPSTKNVSVVTAWAYTIVGFGVVGAAASTVAVAIREHRKEALRHLKQLRKRHARTAMLRGHRAANSVRLWRRGSTGSASSLELGPGESANSAESADAAADGAARVQDAPPPQQDKPDLPAGECSVDNFDVAEHNDSKVG